MDLGGRPPLRFFRFACNCLKYSEPRFAIFLPPFRPRATAAGSFSFAKGGRTKLQANYAPDWINWAKLPQPQERKAGVSNLEFQLRRRVRKAEFLLSTATAKDYQRAKRSEKARPGLRRHPAPSGPIGPPPVFAPLRRKNQERNRVSFADRDEQRSGLLVHGHRL